MLNQKENSMDKAELKEVPCEIPGADEIQNIHVYLFSWQMPQLHFPWDSETTEPYSNQLVLPYKEVKKRPLSGELLEQNLIDLEIFSPHLWK